MRRAHPKDEDQSLRPPGSAPTLTRSVEVSAADRLDCHQIHSAGLAVGHDAPIVGKTLADRWSNVPVPLDRTLIEAKIIAASFLLDFSQALDGVE